MKTNAKEWERANMSLQDIYLKSKNVELLNVF